MLIATTPLALSILLACTPKRDGFSPDTADTASSGLVDTLSEDLDSDGFTKADDCDDEDEQISPAAAEICDGIDNNCDGSIDEGVTSTFYADADGDGFGDEGAVLESCSEPSGYVGTGNDCDDTDGESYPGASERCDSIDNDCDGEVDEDVLSVWYADSDGDRYGDPDSSFESCDPPPGYTDDATDCDDSNGSAYPGGVEVCDTADNDCDGSIDEGTTSTFYRDRDSDNYGVSDETIESCVRSSGYAEQGGDCDDGSPTVSPLALELCDGFDNDCDGDIDEDSAADTDTFYEDADADGYGSERVWTIACDPPSGYIDDSTDCDDTDSSVNPGASEVCDSVDNNCSGWVDDDDPAVIDAVTYFVDADSDGYGSGRYSIEACKMPSGYSDNGDDCDDGDASASPAGSEVCDDVDNDCDGDTDEDASDEQLYFRDSDGDSYGDPDAATESCGPPSGYVEDELDCDDADSSVNPGAAEVCDALDNDCDGLTDEELLGTDASCAALTCMELVDEGLDDGDGLYWIDPDGDGVDAWEAYCDMSTDDGGWTKVFSSQYPTFWSSTGWDDAGDAEDDDYSALFAREYFEDSDGVWTFRLEVGNSGSWDTASRSHYTIWSQEHDAFDDTTDGSDYVYIDGTEPTTCSGFNGLHDRYYTSVGVYSRTADADLYDSVSCWWMQVVPLQQYGTSSSYPGYIEGYGGSGNVHSWQVLWMR